MLIAKWYGREAPVHMRPAYPRVHFLRGLFRMSDEQLLEALIGAAIEAGCAIAAIYRGHFDVRIKADASPVTAADHAAEAIILKHLAVAAPSIPVIAEEEVAAGRVPGIAREFFLVDPLDGTKEFVQRRGDFTVNIALIRDGAPVLGVVYAPATARLFAGIVSSQTAFQANQSPDSSVRAARIPIRVRSVPTEGVTAVASRSHRSAETDSYLERYRVADLVSIGSSLKFCLVAGGEADLYPRLGPTMEWDTAAGHAVLLAAGGTVLAADGAALRYGKPEFRNPSFIAAGALRPEPIS
jgi:3'(2'), 5'-bisphosphate nucleotidase